MDVTGGSKVFEDGYKVYEVVGWCGGVLGGFL